MSAVSAPLSATDPHPTTVRMADAGGSPLHADRPYLVSRDRKGAPPRAGQVRRIGPETSRTAECNLALPGSDPIRSADQRLERLSADKCRQRSGCSAWTD